ncbi:MAG: E3 binding domain-containing protein, partial [Rhizobiales bacterium]|nr:E3 binding domain-containing protein [Hyphomicrobiales bacterium]
MASEIRVPTLGESVTEATIGQWYKAVGDAVNADEPLVELETDKVTVEVPAPSSGTLSEIIAQEGETVEVGALLAMLEAGAGAQAAPVAAAAPAPAAVAAAPVVAATSTMPPSPAAGKALAENNLTVDQVAGSGKRGQVLKEDVLSALEQGIANAVAPAVAAAAAAPVAAPVLAPAPAPAAPRAAS